MITFRMRSEIPMGGLTIDRTHLVAENIINLLSLTLTTSKVFHEGSGTTALGPALNGAVACAVTVKWAHCMIRLRPEVLIGCRGPSVPPDHPAPPTPPAWPFLHRYPFPRSVWARHSGARPGNRRRHSFQKQESCITYRYTR